MDSAGLKSVDINCDLGEGMPCDAEIMQYISSCSIACGGHAGNEQTMRETLDLAKKYNLKIGAHPSYPDKENFGRQTMLMTQSSLKLALLDQVNALLELLNERGLHMHHMKPHGALYNDACRDTGLAELVLEVINETCPEAKLYAPFGSQLAHCATSYGIDVVYEVFADRNYNDDLSLVSRSNENALIHDSNESYLHVRRMLLDNKVTTVQKSVQTIKADTICVHSDTPEAVELVAKLHSRLIIDGFNIQ